jgi:hypothetical protein
MLRETTANAHQLRLVEIFFIDAAIPLHPERRLFTEMIGHQAQAETLRPAEVT